MFDIISLASSSAGNAYVISKGDVHILVECGLPTKRLKAKLLEYDLTLLDIDVCLISHKHKDHSQALKDICPLVKCYCDIDTSEYYGHPQGIKIIDSFKKHTIINNLTWKAIPTNHGNVHCYAFIIEDEYDQLLFLIDSNKLEYSVLKYNFNQVMIECNYLEKYLKLRNDKEIRELNTHMGLEGTLLHLKRMNLKHCQAIYLTHLSDALSDEVIMKSIVKLETKVPTYVCQKDGGVC